MSILSEDVIIRLLVDTQKGVSDLQKASGETTNLAKSALKMAAAMGGAALAFELAVKAITAYINYVKEAETAAVKFAKESGRALDSSVKAYDRLNAAQEESKRIDGELHLQYMENHRERRAARIDETNLVKMMTDAQMEQWRAENAGLTKWNDDFESRVDFMKRFFEEQRKQEVELRQRAENARLRAALELQNIEDLAEAERQREAAREKAEADRLAALAAYQQAERDAMQERADAIRTANELDAQILTTRNDMRRKAHDANMAMIEAEKQAEINAALSVASIAISAISSVFGESKEAAIATAVMNTALAITRLFIDLPIWAAIAATPIMLAAMGKQITTIQSQSYALGTPSSGYTIPPGYEGDTAPVYAKSGETVHVDRPGSGGEMLTANISIDGYQFGTVVTRLFKDRKATVPADVVIA